MTCSDHSRIRKLIPSEEQGEPASLYQSHSVLHHRRRRLLCLDTNVFLPAADFDAIYRVLVQFMAGARTSGVADDAGKLLS